MNPWAIFLAAPRVGLAAEAGAGPRSPIAASPYAEKLQGRRSLDLKWTLVRRIVVVALLCLTGGAILAMHHVAADAGRQNEAAAEAVEKQLLVQVIRITRGLDHLDRFPDWDSVLKFALEPGQCLELLGPLGEVRNARCVGSDERAPNPPGWFVDAYRALFFDRSLAERGLVHRAETWGVIRATIDPTTVARRAWTELTRTLGLWVMMIGALCLLVYVVVDHALRPAAEILAGINRLADGDLSSRLPAFRLYELQRIAEVFNELARTLQATTSDRAEFARKLVDAQERERRLIALELHDDIAQRLTAMSCMAASIGKTVRATAPEAARESEDLVTLASGTMRSLRETLATLRPPEIDDLGLVVSLQELVASHERQARGRTRFTFRPQGRFEDVPAEAAGHIYRIVQESLNNAARHAAASQVEVALREGPPASSKAGERSRLIDLSVRDDGVGMHPATSSDPLSGAGLVGMRERVFALGGALCVEQRAEGGVELRASFPVRLAEREAR
ncbi:HAMP domain-containing sensor histidine kinase [Methylopila sp. Yamaguchi]|uniref:HAMP domain-containing sensor histidine kinase n=1 Tax=Methylopila sp. Yamaguchi TaxID=1437817 RepID=UPI000CBAAA97|nr:sensor histidine kinase [Methylopila sp. Yamaguchi]GBD50205.1 integral membrane sensor signal transduction histidine kinase [Methylopila sp. Yamaguchi]